eukprot:7545042-Alexandrium_andersonii.AAC.1
MPLERSWGPRARSAQPGEPMSSYARRSVTTSSRSPCQSGWTASQRTTTGTTPLPTVEGARPGRYVAEVHRTPAPAARSRLCCLLYTSPSPRD